MFFCSVSASNRSWIFEHTSRSSTVHKFFGWICHESSSTSTVLNAKLFSLCSRWALPHTAQKIDSGNLCAAKKIWFQPSLFEWRFLCNYSSADILQYIKRKLKGLATRGCIWYRTLLTGCNVGFLRSGVRYWPRNDPIVCHFSVKITGQRTHIFHPNAPPVTAQIWNNYYVTIAADVTFGFFEQPLS